MSQGRKTRVLYVEDDECLHEIVGAVLAADGFEVTSVTLAQVALNELEGRTYGIVVLDFHLPDGDAAALLRRAQGRNLLDGLGVIVLTSDRRPIGLRGVPVLHKPVDCDALLAAVRHAASRASDSGVRVRREVSPRLLRVR